MSCLFAFSIKSAFSRSSMNLAGHSSRNPTPLMSRRTQPQAMPTLTLNEASPSPSTENSPMISRSRSSSTNNDLRKQVLLSQSGQLRNYTSAVNLITNQVWSYLLILFGLLPVSLAECSDTALGQWIAPTIYSGRHA